MMNNNKILTVSYGTFSCTLEGFEDSFGTMKAIAEYFRDLASDDRYFGAEPPQPDAEMLARIAEREVSRRVQAREEDGKIHLSAVESADLPAAAMTAFATAPALADVATPDVAIQTDHVDIADLDDVSDGIEVSLEDEDVEDAQAVAAEAEEEAAEREAAENARAEQEAAERAAEKEAAEKAQAEKEAAERAEREAAEQAAAEKEAAEEAAAEAARAANEADDETDLAAITAALEADDTAAGTAEVEEDSPDIVPGQPDAEVEAFFAESAEPVVADVSVDLPETTDEAPAPDSIAAKLQRIRAVVSRQDEAREETAYVEDEHAEMDREASDLIAEARADIEDALDADDAVSAPVAEDAEDDVAALMSRIDDTPMETVAEAMEEAEVDEAEIDLGILAETDDDTVSENVDNLFEEEEAIAAPDVEDANVEEEIGQDEGPDEAHAPAATPPAHPRARVIKVKRADLEAAIAKGDLEEYDDADNQDAAQAADTPPALDDLAPAKSEETALSPEEEADLARELAELEADIEAEAETKSDAVMSEVEDVDTDLDAVAEAEEETQSADEDDFYDDEEITVAPSAKRSSLPSIDDGEDAAMNRLLAETDHKMDEPESADRRDAFAHLRAAVAAKKADSTIEAGDQATKSAGVYRDDLAEVVRPRRPQAKDVQTARPSDKRPAPLKLVAEQRIDVENPKLAGPVRPRRVAASADMTPAEDGESFADFASDMGANTLAEKLEAAAAYLSFVEGREQFSRPQLMSKVRLASGEDGFSREEGLRSFGQLLRAGKIEKIKGGRFTVSEDIGFRPDHRAAG